MRSFYKYLILLLLSHLMFSQNYIDVVYLNNGDIIKGIIIENSPGNHIKIETSNGSVITFDYDEIEKFQRVKQQSDVIEEIKPRIEKPNNKDKKLDVERDMHTKPSFFITIGQFFPSEESMKDIYGKGILSLGGGLRFAYSNSWNYQVGVDYISKKGDPYTWVDDEIELYDATSEIKIIPISFNSEYIFKKKVQCLFDGSAATR